jgi:hypothetical protein
MIDYVTKDGEIIEDYVPPIGLKTYKTSSDHHRDSLDAMEDGRSEKPSGPSPTPPRQKKNRFGDWFKSYNDVLNSVEYRRLSDSAARTLIWAMSYVSTEEGRTGVKSVDGSVPSPSDFALLYLPQKQNLRKRDTPESYYRTQYDELLIAGFLIQHGEDGYALKEWFERQKKYNSTADVQKHREKNG